MIPTKPANPPVHCVGGMLTVYGSRHTRDAVLTVFEMRGGAQGLYDWSEKSEENTRDFYTKIMPKTITKVIDVNDNRSVDDVILGLDTIDAEFTEVQSPQTESKPPQAISEIGSFPANFQAPEMHENSAENDVDDDEWVD